MDLAANKTTDLISGITSYELAGIAVSNDFSNLVYAQSTENSAAPQQALGVFTGAPYTINSVDLATNKVTQITTFGTKGEQNQNGTLKTRHVNVGFETGSNTYYYTNDNQLFTVMKANPVVLFEASKPILMVPYVSSNNIISGSGADTSDYSLTNYNTSTKKSASIFSGDNNTVILGVTTQ